MTDALEHAAFASAQREDVAGPVEGRGTDTGVGQCAKRGRTVGGGDAGGGALGEVDAHRERRAVGFGVLGGDHHRRQVEFVASFAVEADTDDTRGVPHEERNRLRSGGVGGHDQVAFVLAVFVVGDHDDLATGDRCDRIFDRIEPDGHDASPLSVVPVGTFAGST